MQDIAMWETFPCWSWTSNEPLELKSFVQSFQEMVPNQRWVFCRSDVAQTSRQLWTATTVSNRNTERGTAQARTLDAEFLRLLAGTHNVSEAFKRAGLQNKSTSGWLLHIPAEANSINPESIDQQANNLLNGLGLSKTSESLKISLEGAKNLGITLDETIDVGRIEALLIGHILLADVNSSQ